MLCALFLTRPVVARADDDGCPPASGSDADPAYICVTFATGAGNPTLPPKTIQKADLYQAVGRCDACDIQRGQYEVRTAPGGPTSDVDDVYGLSIKKLILMTAGADVLADTTFTQTSEHGGRYQSLLDATRNQVVPAGVQPAVFFVNSPDAKPRYLRPLRAGDDNDVNVKDNLSVTTNFIHVVVHTSGQVLYPTLTIDGGTKHDGGKPVTFRADLDDPPDTPLHYDWDFRDDATAQTDARTTTHTYANQDALWFPTVVVTGDDSSYGQSPSVRLELGKLDPTPGDGDGPGGGKGPTGGPTEGPVRGGGTKAGGAPTGRTGAGGGTGTGTGTAGATSGPGGSAAAPSGSATAAGSATPTARPPAAGASDGELVRGLALFVPQQAGAAPRQAGRAEAASLRSRPRDRIDLRWLLWLVPIGLIALGVYSERRRPRRPGSTP